MSKNFDAVLLAAGYGKRLRPLTNYLPKCLVPLNGCPLIDYWIYSLIKAGANNILINLHYKNDVVESYLDNSPWRSKLTFSFEQELLGTAGTLVKNKHFYKNDICLVAHADNYSDFDLSALIEHHLKYNKKLPITMMTFQTDYPSECGIVDTDKEGIVVGFYEKVKKPPSNNANAAVYIFNNSTISEIGQSLEHVSDISNEVIPHYLGLISTWKNETYHRDIGSLRSYIEAQKYNKVHIDKESSSRWDQFFSRLPENHRKEILKIILN